MRLAFMVGGLAALLAVGAAAGERPAADPTTGCRIRDQYPDSRKTILWSGACRDGFASGPGVLQWDYGGRPDGRVEGTFLDGRLHGTARVTWTDGRRMEGEFRHGLASGYGVHVWPDGRRYEGQWRDDRRTGEGVLIHPDGSRYVGTFHRNRPTGDGVFVSAEGRRFAARVDPRGHVSPGAPLAAGTGPQSAEAPPRTDETGNASLDDWLKRP